MIDTEQHDTCPRCGAHLQDYRSDEIGEVQVCHVCASVWLTPRQQEATTRYVTPSEVIAAYGLGHGTVYNAIRAGWIPSERVGGRVLLRLTDVVKRWGPFPEEPDNE